MTRLPPPLPSTHGSSPPWGAPAATETRRTRCYRPGRWPRFRPLSTTGPAPTAHARYRSL